MATQVPDSSGLLDKPKASAQLQVHDRAVVRTKGPNHSCSRLSCTCIKPLAKSCERTSVQHVNKEHGSTHSSVPWNSSPRQCHMEIARITSKDDTGAKSVSLHTEPWTLMPRTSGLPTSYLPAVEYRVPVARDLSTPLHTCCPARCAVGQQVCYGVHKPWGVGTWYSPAGRNEVSWPAVRRVAGANCSKQTWTLPYTCS